MQKIKDIINNILGKSGSDSSDSSSGFTLIELLIVIAIIGLLAAALLVAIDPIDKIKQGRDTKVINDVRSIYDGAVRTYTQSADGDWPADIDDIVTAGELKLPPAEPNQAYIDQGGYGFITDLENATAWGPVLSKVNQAKSPLGSGEDTWFVITGTDTCYMNSEPSAALLLCP